MHCRARSIMLVVALLWASSSGHASTVFQATVPTLPYAFDPEGGTISNDVQGATTVGPQAIGSGSTQLVLEFRAPSGKQFKYDSTAYNGGAGFNASLQFIPWIYGADPAGLTGAFVSAELVNASGVSLINPSSTGSEDLPANLTPKIGFRFNTGAELSGLGTFDAFRFTYALSNASNQSMSFGSQYVDIYNPTPPIMLAYQTGLPQDLGPFLTLAAVPEPATGVLALAGLACGVATALRRRRPPPG